MLLLFRCVALFCGLVLTLPTGWCCMIRSLSGGSPAQKTAQSPTCHCCPKCKPNSKQSPQPIPATPEHCPCLDHDLSTPESDRPIDATVALPPTVMIVVPVDVACEQVNPIERVSFEPITSRHVLNCLWLC